jgi:hypothetical protein
MIALDYPKPEYESMVESRAVPEEDAEVAYLPGEKIRG